MIELDMYLPAGRSDLFDVPGVVTESVRFPISIPVRIGPATVDGIVARRAVFIGQACQVDTIYLDERGNYLSAVIRDGARR